MLEMLCRIYGVLLFVYPRQFRERYGTEMRRVFREKTQAVLAAESFSGVLRHCASIAADLVSSAIREHIAARTAALLSIRIAMLFCVAVCVAVSWFGLRHRPGVDSLLPGTLGLLEIYGLVALLATRERYRPSSPTLRNATLFGVAAAVVTMVAIPSFFFLPAWKLARIVVEMLLVTGLAGVWLGVAYSAARNSRSIVTGIMAGGWSAMVATLVSTTAGFVLWMLAVWKFSALAVFIPTPGLNTWYPAELSSFAMTSHAMAQLLEEPILGCALGIIGGTAGVWWGARASSSPGPSW